MLYWLGPAVMTVVPSALADDMGTNSAAAVAAATAAANKYLRIVPPSGCWTDAEGTLNAAGPLRDSKSATLNQSLVVASRASLDESENRLVSSTVFTVRRSVTTNAAQVLTLITVTSSEFGSRLERADQGSQHRPSTN
jgi:hypothetical protein